MAADTLLTAVRAHLQLQPDHTVILEPIKRGASGRTIVRLKADGHPPFIGIHYTMERKDNRFFLPVAHFLRKNRLNVPEVLYDNPGRHIALVEDLGEKVVDGLQPELSAGFACGAQNLFVVGLRQRDAWKEV